MTKDEALAYCHRHREEYVRGFDSVDDGIRQFNCLVELIECGDVDPNGLADYGMSFDDKEE